MGSKLAYRLSPLAEQDLEGIWLYTRERWSAEQADLYYHSIISAIEGLLTGGLIPQPADVLPRYLKFKVGRHVIYFKKSEDYLDVIRILHERMDVKNYLSTSAWPV